jgi:hypothetical protein
LGRDWFLLQQHPTGCLEILNDSASTGFAKQRTLIRFAPRQAAPAHHIMLLVLLALLGRTGKLYGLKSTDCFSVLRIYKCRAISVLGPGLVTRAYHGV